MDTCLQRQNHQELEFAIIYSDYAAIERLLRDPNTQADLDNNALLRVALPGDPKAVWRLLQESTVVERLRVSRDCGALSAGLLLATINGHNAVVCKIKQIVWPELAAGECPQELQKYQSVSQMLYNFNTQRLLVVKLCNRDLTLDVSTKIAGFAGLTFAKPTFKPN